MKSSLIDYIVCPRCGGDIRLDAAEVSDGQIRGGRLRCNSQHDYPIDDGVPDLVPRESAPLEKLQTVESFSAKWNKAPAYRTKTGRFYTDWFLVRYGFRQRSGLKDFLAGKRFILDAGTGTGRDAQLYAELSDATVFGLDISEGIRFAYRDLKDILNLHLLRADLTRPPFRPEFFDFIACDQVLHHTPDPERSLRTLVNLLQPGGHIAFYVYKKKGPIREFCDDYIRAATTEMTEEECYRFSEAMTRLGRALAESGIEIDIPEDIPLLGIKAGHHNLQRFLYWNVFKCFWNPEFDYDSNVIINFDWYHPKHAYRYSKEEVEDWCRDMELTVLHLDVIESGISVLARKG